MHQPRGRPPAGHAIYRGPAAVRRAVVDPQEALGAVQGDTTSGQFYHNLRALQGAGWITQRRRGEYELTPQAVIPVLTILAAAMNVNTNRPTFDMSCACGCSA